MIYILSPSNVHTGGTEALHQFSYKLRLLGFNATIYYMGDTSKNTTPKIYEKYIPVYTDVLSDTVDDIIVFPEIFINYLPLFKNARKIIWWLSVDNAIYNQDMENILKTDKTILHLSQSHYATEFIKSEFGIENERIFYISDYLNSEYLSLSSQNPTRDNIVLFNPVKGIQTTVNLIAHSDYRIKWQALKGMTAKQMHETMSKAKLYIDFGGHPGKDRIPREAALSGCLVITNKKGSAKNNFDIKIDSKYKFDDSDYTNILNTIYNMLDNYETYYDDFEVYRNNTKHEFQDYEVDIMSAFEKILNITSIDDVDSPESLLAQIENAILSNDYIRALYLIVKYHQNKYATNETFSIFEATIRLNIGELHEARFCIEAALHEYPANYEMHLIHAQILMALNESTDLIMSTLDKVLEYSSSTPDYELCKNIVLSYTNSLEE